MLKSTRVLVLGVWVLVLDSSTKYSYSIILKVAYSFSKLVYSTPALFALLRCSLVLCSYWMCDNGECVHEQLVCRGGPNCDDGSDEAKCSGECYPPFRYKLLIFFEYFVLEIVQTTIICLHTTLCLKT